MNVPLKEDSFCISVNVTVELVPNNILFLLKWLFTVSDNALESDPRSAKKVIIHCDPLLNSTFVLVTFTVKNVKYSIAFFISSAVLLKPRILDSLPEFIEKNPDKGTEVGITFFSILQNISLWGKEEMFGTHSIKGKSPGYDTYCTSHIR